MTFRFVLLIAAVLATSTYYLLLIAPPGVATLGSAVLKCAAATGIAGSIALAQQSAADVPHMQAQMAAFNRCMAPTDEIHAWWVLGALAAVAVLTLGTCWLMPWWKIRRGRLVPLGVASSPSPSAAGLAAELDELVREAGLARAPGFLLDPASPAIGGLAFGAFGRYYVRLDAGLVVLRARDPAGFRAVIRHELGHLRNHDVDQTYLTVALWRVFLLLFLVPLAAASAAPRLVGDPLRIKTPLATPSMLALVTEFWLPMGCLVAMVYLIRNAVLRARELRADARAAAAGSGPDVARMLGSADSGGRGLSAGRDPSGSGDSVPDHGHGLRRGLRGLLGTHPAAQAREEAVRDPGRLFRFGFWEAAAAGVSVSVSYLLLSLSLSLLVFMLPGEAAAGATALILAVITGGLITLGIWRGSWYAMASGHPLPSMIRPGLGLAAGLAAGAALTRPAERLLPLPVAVVIGVALAVIIGWVAGLAAAWLPTLRGQSPQWPWLAATAAAAVVTAAVFQLWLAPDGLSAAFPIIGKQLIPVYTRAAALAWAGPRWLWDVVWTPLWLGTTAMRLTFVAFLLLWAAPLLGWLRASRADKPGWPLRGVPGGGDGAQLPHESAKVLPRRAASKPLPRGVPRLRPALAAGAVAGGFAFTASFALRAALHVSLPIGVLSAAAFALLLTFWEVALAVAAQMLAAGLIAATARRRGVVLAMLAAAITAVLAVLGMVASARVGSCVSAFTIRPQPCHLVPNTAFVTLTLQLTALDGGAAALILALAVTGVRTVLRLLQGAARLDLIRLWRGLPEGGRADHGTASAAWAGALAQAVSTAEASDRPSGEASQITAARPGETLAGGPQARAGGVADAEGVVPAQVARAGELEAGEAAFARETPSAGETRAGGTSIRRFAVMVGVVAVLTAATVLAWPSASSAPGSPAATALTFPVTPGPAVTTWWRLGGEALTHALDRDLLTLSKANSYATLSAACTATRTDAGKAIAFAPVPDTATQQTWFHAVAALQRGASDCLSALGGAGRQVARRSGSELLDGTETLTRAINHITSLINAH